MPVRMLMAECRIHGTSNDRTNMRIAFSFFLGGGGFLLIRLETYLLLLLHFAFSVTGL